MRAFTVLFVLLGLVGAVPAPGIADPGRAPRPRVHLIPQPVRLVEVEGEFRFTPATRVSAEGDALEEARRLIDALSPAMGFRLRLDESSSPSKSTVLLEIDPSLKRELTDEGYTLRVSPECIELRAARRPGLFYGIQTLRQLLPPAVHSPAPGADEDWIVPALEITDDPRFAWRGLLIDPARHFIPVEDVLRFIDTMALHKFNRLQMHLTDDQGWRIEIRKYPRLTEVGAWRRETLLGHMSRKPWRFDGTRHGGFYTQDDIRKIVGYAAARHITIVPEIEMPGHTRAAISAYPHLGVFPDEQKALEPWTRWGVSEDILAPRAATIEFCRDVLTEVMELFPSRFIHIGGDEAVKTQWKRSEEIQRMIRDLGVGDEAGLQSWFTRQLDEFLARHGRRLVGWDEILEGGLAPGAVVMSWRGERGGIAAARAGHDVIMAPTSHTYFDYYQGPAKTEPLAIGGYIPLEKVYRYEPIPAALASEHTGRVLGAQAQLWSEYISRQDHREYMAYPRAAALSEVLWSPLAVRDYDAFLDRLEHHLLRLRALGVNYRPLDPPLFAVPEEPEPEGLNAVQALLRRLLPDHVDRFRFEVIQPVRGRDVFEIESFAGEVVIRGNNAVALSTGLGWYLKHGCLRDVSWRHRELVLDDPLPTVKPKVRRVAWARYRYFLNYCCFGYSLPWWDWEQWEKLIDWMALNGINMPLSVTGQEAVWQTVCRRLGLSDRQIDEFLAGPPYLPFGWMGCLDGWGGPLPEKWIDRHAELGRKILDRQRELGMTPVLQGFTGHVPAAVGEKFPGTRLHEIHWIEWKTKLLDPLDPLYSRIARLFMEEQTRRFGTDHLYAADTFIEMTPPSGDPKFLAALARAIYNGMASSDPRAVWVLQGWTFMNQQSFWTQPRIRSFLDAIDDERMIVLDLFCEARPQWNRTEAFYGKPWVWCNIQNFGGRIFLGGAVQRIHRDLPLARQDPGRGQLVGLGFVNEALGYNPVVFDRLFESAWRDGPIDPDQWTQSYSRRRYGRLSDDAEAAWRILTDTVYQTRLDSHSVITRVPSLEATSGVPYENARLASVWKHLLRASSELGGVETYRFDLVNVARQVLSNHASDLQHDLKEAYGSADGELFSRASQRFLEAVRDLDELLATRPEFLLGRWLADARRWGTTDADRARCEWNARRVLTLWGTGQAIRDYASREWAGMLRGYYLERWTSYVEALNESLEKKQAFDADAFGERLWAWERDWASRSETYPTEPRGDSISVAKRLWTKYGDTFRPDAESLTTGKPVTCSTSLPGHPARLANDGYSRNTDRYWAMDVSSGDPTWWQVDLEEPCPVGRVVVVGYYGDRRFYGFTVEASLDGKTWEVVADRRDNKELSTAKGYSCPFEPRPVRYLRVTQTANSANTGRHLVEVMAFGE